MKSNLRTGAVHDDQVTRPVKPRVHPVADAAVEFAGTTLVAFTEHAMWAINDVGFTHRPKAAHPVSRDVDTNSPDVVFEHRGAFWRCEDRGEFSIVLEPTHGSAECMLIETGPIEAAFLIVIGSIQ